MAHGFKANSRAGGHIGEFVGGAGFYDYYHISTGDEDNSPGEREPIEDEGVKGYVEGLHSPFGQIYQIIQATHWPLKKVLWGVNFPTLMMMAADAPRYVQGEKPVHVTIENEDQLFAALEKKLDKKK